MGTTPVCAKRIAPAILAFRAAVAWADVARKPGEADDDLMARAIDPAAQLAQTVVRSPLIETSAEHAFVYLHDHLRQILQWLGQPLVDLRQ